MEIHFYSPTLYVNVNRRYKLSLTHRRAYILPLRFFFLLFSTPNIGGHWTDLNQTWTHIHLWLIFEKIGPNFPGHLPQRAEEQKTLFWDRLWALTEHISLTEYDINNRNETCQSTATSLHDPQIWWTLVQKRLKAVGEFLPTP